MATITALAPADGVTEATKQWKQQPILLSNVIDFADALRLKGTALAANDIIEAIRFPSGGYVIHFAGLQTIAVDDATTLTLHVGLSGDPDGFVVSYDQAAAVAGAYATMLFDASEVQVINTAADSLDITLATLTGTLTAGKVRVFALVTAISGEKQAGLATFNV
jgi:hypothetical protein